MLQAYAFLIGRILAGAIETPPQLVNPPVYELAGVGADSFFGLSGDLLEISAGFPADVMPEGGRPGRLRQGNRAERTSQGL